MHAFVPAQNAAGTNARDECSLLWLWICMTKIHKLTQMMYKHPPMVMDACPYFFINAWYF
jgi:hypothetical protein